MPESSVSSELFVASYDGYSKRLYSKLVVKAHKELEEKYQCFLAAHDVGTGSKKYLIDGGIVSTNSHEQSGMDLIHTSRYDLEKLAKRLGLPFPSPNGLPQINFNYSDLNGSPFLDIHRRK
jgi:hypothetical protein